MEDFAELGIDMHDYTIPIPKVIHEYVHAGPWSWNDEWGAFFAGKAL
jgi:hypothetical protein